MRDNHEARGDVRDVPTGTWRPVSAAGTLDERRAEAARARAVADCEARLHAVRSSLAGLSSGLHLLADKRAEIPEASRSRVESLLVSEVERLRRLVAPPVDEEHATELEELDLDRLIGDVVYLRNACGQDVEWEQSGCVIRGRADDVVESLNILLVNAWRHAPGGSVRIETSRKGALVLVTVTDDGPGVPPELRQRIFERGVRRPGSSGQGIGLAMARDLVENAGGRLTLSLTRSGGASFCIALPAADRQGAA